MTRSSLLRLGICASAVLGFIGFGQSQSALRPLMVVVDLDDDDRNGVADAHQDDQIPIEDLVPLPLPSGATAVRASAGLRFVQGGRALGSRVAITPRHTRDLRLQGTALSAQPGPSLLTFETPRGEIERAVHLVRIDFLSHTGSPIGDAAEALRVSRALPNGPGLPRRDQERNEVSDPATFRVQVYHDLPGGQVRLFSQRASAPLSLPLARRGRRGLSPWLRLVTTEADSRAPVEGDRFLITALGERLNAEYRAGPLIARQNISVGRSSSEDPDLHILRGRLRVRLLRVIPGGPPSVGRDDAHALTIARRQVAIANAAWAQCAIDFGDPELADIAIVDPPEASLLSISNQDGLAAIGGSLVRFEANGQPIAVSVEQGSLPSTTALAIVGALEAAGFEAQSYQNNRTEFGAHASADVTATTSGGQPIRFSAIVDTPLSSDGTQRVEIGNVNLRDGLMEFDNHEASSGTLEERTLLRHVMDADPQTIDVILINRFTNGSRRGEAFIESNASSFMNSVIIERSGLELDLQALTVAHEIGHVILNHPYHPEEVGPPRPQHLMSALATDPTSRGARRLDDIDCRRARAQSGPLASPALLLPLP